MDVNKIVSKILKFDKKKKIEFIVLFGSVANGKSTGSSDIDFAVYYKGNKKERFNFRVNSLGNLPDEMDLQIFQGLPLTVKKEVLSGKLLYFRNYQFVFDEYMKVIKEFNYFEKYYLEYIHSLENEVAST